MKKCITLIVLVMALFYVTGLVIANSNTANAQNECQYNSNNKEWTCNQNNQIKSDTKSLCKALCLVGIEAVENSGAVSGPLCDDGGCAGECLRYDYACQPIEDLSCCTPQQETQQAAPPTGTTAKKCRYESGNNPWVCETNTQIRADTKSLCEALCSAGTVGTTEDPTVTLPFEEGELTIESIEFLPQTQNKNVRAGNILTGRVNLKSERAFTWTIPIVIEIKKDNELICKSIGPQVRLIMPRLLVKEHNKAMKNPEGNACNIAEGIYDVEVRIGREDDDPVLSSSTTLRTIPGEDEDAADLMVGAVIYLGGVRLPSSTTLRTGNNYHIRVFVGNSAAATKNTKDSTSDENNIYGDFHATFDIFNKDNMERVVSTKRFYWEHTMQSERMDGIEPDVQRQAPIVAFVWTPTQPGEYIMRANVDTEDQIIEIDDDNNIFNREVNVTGASIPGSTVSTPPVATAKKCRYESGNNPWVCETNTQIRADTKSLCKALCSVTG